MTKEEMITRIELVADTQRMLIVGDPVRAFEYQLTKKEAREFKARDYQDPVPQTIVSWMDASGLDRIQATETTLQMADAFNYALNEIHRIRLSSKYRIQQLSDPVEQESVFNTAISSLKPIVA